MAEIREHLTKAPLNEALIDLRASLPEDFDGERFLELKEVLAPEYPNVQVQRMLSAQFQFSDGVPAHMTEQRVHGVKFASQDEKQIVQFRIDGFTLNRIRPYTSWNELFPEALRLWKLYLDLTSVDHVPRVAVRYINRIDLPLPVSDFRDHFTVPPDIPDGLPQTLSSFLTRVVIEDNETRASAIVTQALEKGLDDQSTSVILDIDAYREGHFQSDPSNLTPIFEELHTLKNRIFFGFITEHTAARYE